MSQEFSNLLKQSKVLHLNPAQPVAITAHAGYLHRGDFGLKRPLPASSRRSPYFKIQSLDTSVSREGQGQTDFVSAAKEALFVKRWEQSGYKTRSSKPDIGAVPTILTSQFDRPTYDGVLPGTLDGDAAPAFVNVRSAMPDVLSLSEADFAAFLQELRALQPDFKAHLQQQAKQARQARPPHSKKRPPGKQLEPAAAPTPAEPAGEPAEETDLYRAAASTSASASKALAMTSFLRSPAAREAYQRVLAARSEHLQARQALEGNRHEARGLNYSDDPEFDDEHYERLVPARVVQIDPPSKAHGKRLLVAASTLGLLMRGEVRPGSANKGLATPVRTPFEAQQQQRPGDQAAASTPIEQVGLLPARITRREFATREASPRDGLGDDKLPVWLFEKDLARTARHEGVAQVPDFHLSFDRLATVDRYENRARRVGSRAWVDNGKAGTVPPPRGPAGTGRAPGGLSRKSELIFDVASRM